MRRLFSLHTFTGTTRCDHLTKALYTNASSEKEKEIRKHPLVKLHLFLWIMRDKVREIQSSSSSSERLAIYPLLATAQFWILHNFSSKAQKLALFPTILLGGWWFRSPLEVFLLPSFLPLLRALIPSLQNIWKEEHAKISSPSWYWTSMTYAKTSWPVCSPMFTVRWRLRGK